jgi:hypothetical protein
MASEAPRDISDILASDPDVIVQAVREAVREAVHRHKQLGLPMAVWRDGAVVWIAPEDLQRQMEDEP